MDYDPRNHGGRARQPKGSRKGGSLPDWLGRVLATTYLPEEQSSPNGERGAPFG